MWQVCAQLRAIDSNSCLLTCADGRDLVLLMDAVSVLLALRSAHSEQSTEPLGEPLATALKNHGCFIEAAEACKPAPSPLPMHNRSADSCETAPSEANADSASGAGAVGTLIPNAGTPDVAPAFVIDSDVVVCGERVLGELIAKGLQEQGVQAFYSARPVRECAYQVFDRGTLVVCRGDQSPQVFAQMISDISGLNISLITIDHSVQHLLVGPVVLNGVGATYQDALLRAAGTATRSDVFQAKLGQPLWDTTLPHLINSVPLVTQAARLIKDITTSTVDSAKSSPIDTIWAINKAGELAVHAVLPVELVMSQSDRVPIHPPSFVVDKHYGIVKEITTVRYSSYMPASLHTTQARAADLRRTANYVNTVFCQGSTLIPANLADTKKEKLIHGTRLAAIGESVERYCSNLIDLKPVLHGSYRELKRKGVPLLAPEEIVLFSDEQYRQPGFPFVKFDLDLPIGWVEGTYYDDKTPVFVPASLVYVNWHTNQYRNAPRINFPAFAGVAAGTSYEQAVLSGLSEVIERHATMVWWLNAFPLPHLELLPEHLRLFEGTCEPLRASLIHLDNTFGIPVLAGVVHNDTSQLVHVGFSCRATVQEAALKAWSEALTLQEGAHDLANPDGAHWQAIRKGLLPGRSYKPWRKDRRYLDDFRADFKDVDDLLIQQEVFLDPRAVERVRPLLDLEPTKPISAIDEMPGGALGDYVDRVHKRGMRIITVNITSNDVASCGLQVIRTLIPGTVGNTPAAFPYLGNGVVTNEAVKLGWYGEPKAECALNLFPMPHA
ncbi:MAG: YcaO-like family protein [Arcanobacterium sp.]|nr:YcaO-like family protein [Arcanobacterium sp.]